MRTLVQQITVAKLTYSTRTVFAPIYQVYGGLIALEYHVGYGTPLVDICWNNIFVVVRSRAAKPVLSIAGIEASRHAVPEHGKAALCSCLYIAATPHP
jgi:hypothetical protein